MISTKIKELRIKNGLTQKDLAEKLYVTSQAVSRWENGDVEPSIDTISLMAEIFNVTTDEMIGHEKKTTPPVEKKIPPPPLINKIEQPQQIIKVIEKETRPVLAVCELCNRPIYDGDEIVRTRHSYGRRNSRDEVVCSDCDIKRKQELHQEKVDYGRKQRNRSFIWSTVFAIIALVIALLVVMANKYTGGDIVLCIVFAIGVFTLSSCMFLNNNYICTMFLAVASWGFVKFPGLIFSFDLDGFIWLIGMKILFWILGFMLGALSVIFACLLCGALSIFEYPIALIRNIKNPEETEEF